MFTQNLSLPFKTEEAYRGLAAIQGLMRVEARQLVLEYQIKDKLVGMLKSGPKELPIPFKYLNELEYKANWFVTRLRIHINSIQVLGDFPIGQEGVITLTINRKHRQKAKELISQTNLRLSEYRLEMMDRDE